VYYGDNDGKVTKASFSQNKVFKSWKANTIEHPNKPRIAYIKVVENGGIFAASRN
jgi:hypothetical protein